MEGNHQSLVGRKNLIGTLDDVTELFCMSPKSLMLKSDRNSCKCGKDKHICHQSTFIHLK